MLLEKYPYKLSVITICYNEPDLEKTCESIVNQTWQDFEWIVIDGGSDESTQKVFEKYKSRMDVFVSEPDNGIYNAMNKGIKYANGEYLNFMNAGDSFHTPTVLEDIFVKKKYNSDILYGDEYMEYKDAVFYIPKKIDKYFLINNTVRHASSFIKSSLFVKYGAYSEEYKIVSDYEKFIVFFLHHCKYKYVPVVIANYKGKGISGVKSPFYKLHKQERAAVINKYFSKKDIKRASDIKSGKKVKPFLFAVYNEGPRLVIKILGVKLKFRAKNT